MEFYKVHGLGNDFILVDGLARRELADLDWPALAPRLCNRHTGIGADGILLLTPAPPAQSPAADIRMRIFNADGSEAQMCGNGIRCIARHMVIHHRWPGPLLRVLTPRGVLPITFDAGPGAFTATVDMGEPILSARQIPIDSPADRFVDQPLLLRPDLNDRDLAAAVTALGPPARAIDRSIEIRATAVSMGNPHAVVFISDAPGLPLAALGPALESHPAFPEKANAQFLHVTGRSAATLRTWERGAGPTQACGTGACAALVAGVLASHLERRATIHLPGGPLLIRWDEASNHVFMTGPAEEVYRGVVALTGR
ncbi:MAG: diaminopimelate epimerase [Phycisphaerales bacterium]|nr:diaminopimelate epimerase [Phycisphaerales bacterium]